MAFTCHLQLYNLDPLPWTPDMSIPGLFPEEPSMNAVHPYFLCQDTTSYDPLFEDPPTGYLCSGSSALDTTADHFDPTPPSCRKQRNDANVRPSPNSNTSHPQQKGVTVGDAFGKSWSTTNDSCSDSSSSDSDSDSDDDDDEYDPNGNFTSPSSPPQSTSRRSYKPTPLEAALINYDEAFTTQFTLNNRLRCDILKQLFWRRKMRAAPRSRRVASDDNASGQTCLALEVPGKINRFHFSRSDCEAQVGRSGTAVSYTKRELSDSSWQLKRARTHLWKERVADMGEDMAMLEEAMGRETALKAEVGVLVGGRSPVIWSGRYRVAKQGRPARNPMGARLRIGKKTVDQGSLRGA